MLITNKHTQWLQAIVKTYSETGFVDFFYSEDVSSNRPAEWWRNELIVCHSQPTYSYKYINPYFFKGYYRRKKKRAD